MSVSVSMPQLGESVTEGTVTRWLKKEGERVEADEPLLEVSTDKVDTEIPSPVSGILRGITVAEDETVAVGAELAVIDESADGAAAAPAPPAEAAPEQAPPAEAAPEYPQAPAAQEFAPVAPAAAGPAPGYEPAGYAPTVVASVPADQVPPAAPPAEQAPAAVPDAEQVTLAAPAAEQAPVAEQPPVAEQAPVAEQVPPAVAPAADGSGPADAAVLTPAADAAPPASSAPPPTAPAAGQAPPAAPPAGEAAAMTLPSAADGPYVTPLVRKLAAEHAVDLATVTGTGVGGRIRKQDVLEAARAGREAAPAAPAAVAPSAAAPAAAAPAATSPAAAAPPAPAAAPAAKAVIPSTMRGTTERMSRARQLIARRMVESLQTSAQLTTVVEADVTLIARLRERAKADFEAREGVKLSFLPFFALATVEALKVHPRLNALIDTEAGQVIYHDAEHLGIAVDTERGLMVPVIQNAGDLNIGGLARKIADLAERTRAGQVSPDDLAGGTFTLTNTGSRGALFDTPIINQPQVAILGTGAVVKRPVVVEDPALGEVITVRSMVYLALTYDHRLVDGADAARFLVTVKDRLEEGAFEAELGL
ncbi:MAG TPA: 2-oxo acid dehydrogenase subunit E2 [Streptosporangiaceae bacterium]|nr:2-oxo acid dehydrogenase subunit E2 [Streptosporangiaceae bacterium]